MKRIMTAISFIFIFGVGSLIDSIDFRAPQPVTISEADAYVRGGARRVSRRTARRTSYRHNHYRRPVVYGTGAVVATGAAVAATAAAISIGTRAASLPTGCRQVSVNGRLYYDCSGTFYQPQYDGPDVVYVVVDNPH